MNQEQQIKTDKTRVDDLIIEMITPKLKEIEQKFSDGKGLTQEDINTLLLKSQYNHINHLDDKLNEVTTSVIAIENKFDTKFNNLNSEFDIKFNNLNSEFKILNERIEHTIQKALNKNMFMLVTMMGFFLTLSKALDIFLK